jgi:hypothetical protein
MRPSLFSLGLIVISAFFGQAQTLPAIDQITIYAKTPRQDHKPLRPAKGGISSFAKQTITACYYEHKSQYDVQARTVLARYPSSSVRQAIIQLAEHFADTLITRIDETAKTLSFSDRQVFWKVSGIEIEKALKTFCNEHGSPSTEELHQNIDKTIQTKIRFG